MAKKYASESGPQVSKAQVIRQYLESHPEAMPKAAAEDLRKQGFDIKPQAVSLVKHHLKKAGETATLGSVFAPAATSPASTLKKRGPQTRSAPGRVRSEEISFESLRKAKELAAQIGGVAKARAALDALAQLTG